MLERFALDVFVAVVDDVSARTVLVVVGVLTVAEVIVLCARARCRRQRENSPTGGTSIEKSLTLEAGGNDADERDTESGGPERVDGDAARGEMESIQQAAVSQ